MANKRNTLSRQSIKSKDATSPNKNKNEASTKLSSIDPEDDNSLDGPCISDDEEGGTRVGDIYIPPPIQPHCSTESKGPRLIITMISNENFKSYAGKVILGPFHHCFTAIIGPNGSGKSNVIDSMLFVFGYRANKIRCDKLRKLLHSSTKGGNADKCCVAVHFKQIMDKEGGECEEVEGSEIIVARTAFYDNSSFYTINGKRVQFKEVSKLLKEHGVDLDHNRFLILQGEVESIAMMKAKGKDNECGMLEYLEDIVGTSRYKEPLIKLNNKVEKLTEERTEKHNRCKLAEREMKDLEQPYSEAITYLKLENTLTRTKNLEIQKVLSTLNKRMNEYEMEKEEIATELKTHDDKYDELKKERLEKEAAIKEETLKYDNLCKAKEDLEIKLKDTLKNFQEVQSTMEETNKRRKQNKSQLEKLGEKLIDLKKVPEKNQSEIDECEKKIINLNKTKNELEEELQRNYALLESCSQPLIEEREIFETELIDITKKATEAKCELSLAESELKILQHDETTEKRKYETLRSSMEESKASLKERTQQLKEIESEIPEFKKEITLKTKEIENYRAEEDCIRNNLRKTQAEITEKVTNMRATKSNNKVLDFLMRQKNEGKIPGILGRLGDLGAIDAKYDIAISTSCGRLDNIVVDTVNTAQTCIEHLKRHDVGRASFVALEKVSRFGYMSQERSDIPQGAMRLFDLIRVEDERVLSAFYFAIRDTLVAENLDEGTKIAYGKRRYRVVTLNGDLIEISGTMSGGGRTQIRGKMGQKVATKTKQSNNSSMVSQKAVEDLQVYAEELQSRVNFIQEEQGRLEREIQSLKINLQQKESERGKLSITINSLSQQLPRIENQLKTQRSRMEKTTSDQGKVSKLQSIIEVKQKNFNTSNTEALKLTTKIDEINEKIANIHGEKVKSVQTKINNASKQIKTLTNNISKLKVEVITSERNFVKIEKQIEELKTEITETENAIRSLNTKRENYDTEGVEIGKQIEEAKNEILKANKDTSHVQKEIIAIQKQESDGQLIRIEIEQKMQTIDNKIDNTKGQIPHFKNQLKPLKLQEIPGETDPPESLKTFTEEELESQSLKDIEYSHELQAKELSTLKPNLSCIAEYQNKREVYLERVKFLEDITNKRNEMRQVYDDVRKKRFTEFLRGFHIITKKLKEMYQMITQGGDAELELVDSMDPFTEGVSFSVRPPKKTWKNISNLSGGEKTLSSLALVFALHYYKPSPLYFMDEIDAALDFKNISIVAHYIKERTKNAQFIIISLRSNMFELSDYLVGIYKVQDCTNSVTIKNQVPDTMIVANNKNRTLSNQNDSFSQLKASNNLTTTRVNQLSNTNNNLPSNNQANESVMDTSSINVSVFKTPAVPPSVSRLADTVQKPLTSSLSLGI